MFGARRPIRCLEIVDKVVVFEGGLLVASLSGGHEKHGIAGLGSILAATFQNASVSPAFVRPVVV